MSGQRETKIYQVWHDTGWPESRIAQLNGGSERHFPDDYAHVANVQANGLRQAVEMTTDKGGIVDDPRRWQPWEKNEGVEALVKAPRDTTAGDVIVDPSMVAYRFENDGFREIAPERTDYNRALETAADRGSAEEPDRGPER